MEFYIYFIVYKTQKCYDINKSNELILFIGKESLMNTPAVNLYAKSSLVLGIISIITMFMGTIYIPFITGGIAIILAMLSRGSARSLATPAAIGLITSCIGIVLNVGLIATSLTLYATNPEIKSQVNSYLEQITGQEIDENATLADLYNSLLSEY